MEDTAHALRVAEADAPGTCTLQNPIGAARLMSHVMKAQASAEDGPVVFAKVFAEMRGDPAASKASAGFQWWRAGDHGGIAVHVSTLVSAGSQCSSMQPSFASTERTLSPLREKGQVRGNAYSVSCSSS